MRARSSRKLSVHRTTAGQAGQLFGNILLMIYFLTLGIINGITNAFTVLNMLLPEPLPGGKITGYSGKGSGYGRLQQPESMLPW